MLKRAYKLQDVITDYIDRVRGENISHFSMTRIEWRQIAYLIELLTPFYNVTVGLSATSGPTIHKVFEVYNFLFTHLESSLELLAKKTARWKKAIRTGVELAFKKLSKYYRQTYKDYGFLYAFGTILNPKEKFETFKSDEWNDDDHCWHDEYYAAFQKLFRYYKEQNPSVSSYLVQSTSLSELDRRMQYTPRAEKRRRITESSDTMYSEIEVYVAEGTTFNLYINLSIFLTSFNLFLGCVNQDILLYWKANTERFPILSIIARDVIAVAAAGVGMERMFNTSRDICHYRRGRLQPDTIRAIMIQICSDRFQIKEEYRDLVDDLDEAQTRQLVPDIDDQDDKENPVYISEDESGDNEGDSESDGEGDGEEDSLPTIETQGRVRRLVSTKLHSSRPSGQRAARVPRREGQYKE